MTSKFFKTLPVFALLVLSGCQGANNPFNKMSFSDWTPDWSKLHMPGQNQMAQSPGCPQIAIMPDLGKITQIRDNQILSETSFTAVTPSCKTDGAVTTARLSIGFQGHLGTAGVKDASSEVNYSIPYLIAVVNPQGQIISKDIFAISMTYKKGQLDQTFSDLLEQTVPVQPGEKPSQYKILLGFQLDEQELAYNRALAGTVPTGLPPNMK